MKAYVYILRCANGLYYTGSTTSLERRMMQHQSGEGANFTRKYLPVELVYFEEFMKISDAFEREKQVQGWSRKKKEALISGSHNELPELSKNYTKFGKQELQKYHFDKLNDLPVFSVIELVEMTKKIFSTN